MDYATFTRTTAERAGVPEETAERIEHATLRTLADRISGGEAQDLAAQLPARLQDDLRPRARRRRPSPSTSSCAGSRNEGTSTRPRPGPGPPPS